MGGIVAVSGHGNVSRKMSPADIARSMANRLGHRGALSDVVQIGDGAVGAVGSAQVARIGNVAACVHGQLTLPKADEVALAERLAATGRTDLAVGDFASRAAIAIAKWGADAIDRFAGDYALVALDADGQVIVAARDSSGLKPLLWRKHQGRAFFSSEAGPLVDSQAMPRPRVNEAMIGEYLSGAPQHREETTWLGVDRIEPRTAVIGRGRLWHIKRSPFDFERTRDTSTDWDSELHDIFVNAVSSRLGDNATAVELSGGFDSTTVLGVAASLRDEGDLIAAVRDYTGTPTEETRYWRAALEQFGVEALVTPWDVEIAPWMIDDARATADRPCLPHLGPWRNELARLSRRGIAVSLTGQGGDERLGHSYQLPWQLLQQGKLKDAVLAAQHHLGADEHRAAKFVASRGPRRLLTWHLPLARFSNRHITGRSWLRDELVKSQGLTDRLRRPRYTDNSMTVNELAGWAFGEIPNQYLEASERCAARQGIEIRHPFVDSALVDLCLSMPESIRTSVTDPRAAHKRVFRQYLPSLVHDRKDKADFSAHYIDRLSNEGILTSADRAAIVQAGWIEQDWLAAALADVSAGDTSKAALLSILATIEAWAQAWL